MSWQKGENLCVCDGQTNHLKQCQVECQDDQVPIEQLIKFSSKKVCFITLKTKNKLIIIE